MAEDVHADMAESTERVMPDSALIECVRFIDEIGGSNMIEDRILQVMETIPELFHMDTQTRERHRIALQNLRNDVEAKNGSSPGPTEDGPGLTEDCPGPTEDGPGPSRSNEFRQYTEGVRATDHSRQASLQESPTRNLPVKHETSTSASSISDGKPCRIAPLLRVPPPRPRDTSESPFSLQATGRGNIMAVSRQLVSSPPVTLPVQKIENIRGPEETIEGSQDETMSERPINPPLSPPQDVLEDVLEDDTEVDYRATYPEQFLQTMGRISIDRPTQKKHVLRGLQGPVNHMPFAPDIVWPMSKIAERAFQLGIETGQTPSQFLNGVINRESTAQYFDGQHGLNVEQYQEMYKTRDLASVMATIEKRVKAPRDSSDRCNYEESFDWATVQYQVAHIVSHDRILNTEKRRLRHVLRSYTKAEGYTGKYLEDTSQASHVIQELARLREGGYLLFLIIGGHNIRACLKDYARFRGADLVSWARLMEPLMTSLIGLGAMQHYKNLNPPTWLKNLDRELLEHAGYPDNELQDGHRMQAFGALSMDQVAMDVQLIFPGQPTFDEYCTILDDRNRQRRPSITIIVRTGFGAVRPKDEPYFNSAGCTTTMLFPKKDQPGSLFPIIASHRQVEPGGLVGFIPGTLHLDVPERPAPTGENIFKTHVGVYLEAHDGPLSGLRRTARMASDVGFDLPQNVDLFISESMEQSYDCVPRFAFFVFARMAIAPFTPIVWRGEEPIEGSEQTQ